MLAAVFLLGMTSCSSSDDSTPKDTKVLEQELAGLWWHEYDCADFTEAGVPFSRAMLAIKTNPDHTGCIYLGVFDEGSDEPFDAINALLKAFQDKGVELKELIPSK